MCCLTDFLGFTGCPGALCADFLKAGHQSLRSQQFAGSSENSAWATLIHGLCPHVEIKGESKCLKLLLMLLNLGKKNRLLGFLLHLSLLPVPSLIAQRNIPSLCVEGILHPRTSVNILWLMHQGAAAGEKQEEEVKRGIVVSMFWGL